MRHPPRKIAHPIRGHYTSHGIKSVEWLPTGFLPAPRPTLMLRSFLLYLSERQTPKNLLTRLPAARRLPLRFIAGEELEDAARVVRRLNEEGFEATLDYLGESVRDRGGAAEASRVYAGILDRLAAAGLRANVSVKLTQLGLDIGPEVAHQNLASILDAARRLRSFVRIDMEGSAYTQSTLRIFYEAGAPRDVLGVVIQAYLFRSAADVEDLLRHGARIRLVKGAYQEPASLAFPRKADVDRNFVRLMEKLLASDGYHAIATHDPAMIRATLEFARGRGLGPERFEFQMLYGIRRDLQRALRREGYRVRVYVPFGRQWYPYFVRRLAERPANVLFLLRNLWRA